MNRFPWLIVLITFSKDKIPKGTAEASISESNKNHVLMQTAGNVGLVGWFIINIETPSAHFQLPS